MYPIKTSQGLCVVEVDVDHGAPGVYPIRVSYGEPGSLSGSLAGFFVAHEPGAPPAVEGLQPGTECTAASTCLEAPPYSCGCLDGRCQCE